MKSLAAFACALVLLADSDWPRFRGPDGTATIRENHTPGNDGDH